MFPQVSPLDRLLKLLYAALVCGVALVFYKVFFRPLLPLAVAFLLSCAIAGPARRLHEKSRLPKGLCALLVLAALAAVLCGGGWLLGRLAMSQLRQLGAVLPQMLQSLQESLLALQHRLQSWFPGKSVASQPQDWLASLSLPELGLEGLAGSLGWAAASLPDLLLTCVFLLASTVLLVRFRDETLSFLRRQLPPRMLEAARKLRDYLKEVLLGWAKAQGILAAVTLGLLLAGFFLLRVQGGLLLAFVIALLDALPVLGAGLALIPWALAQLLLGSYGRALGLVLLYILLVAVRNALEPHVVGKQIGLHPLVSLIAFYLGWRLAGLPGMLLGPILVLILVKLREWGYSKLWR